MKVKKVSLIEGASYSLNNDELANFKTYMSQNPELPMMLNGNILSFNDYTIGSVTVGDTSIIINPRIKGLTANDYFEMQLYNEGVITDSLQSLLGESSNYGLEQNIVSAFLNECLDLTKKGLEGQFSTKVEFTNIIHGKILVNRIKPIDLLQNKIPIEYTIHTMQTIENKIIKLALEKCRLLVNSSNQKKKLGLVKSYFENINVTSSDYPRLISRLNTLPSTHFNKNYTLLVKLSRKIIEGITLNMRQNKILGSSYLVNSNNLFESYGRKILKDHLRKNVEKWDSPKNIAKFTYQDNAYFKSYIPDILIDYNSNLGITYALLDTKNKDISDLQNAAKLPDLYQVVFYCQKLKTRFAGLVYPSNQSLPPLKVAIDGLTKINFYIFTIDFSKTLKLRHLKYVEDVKKIFHVN